MPKIIIDDWTEHDGAPHLISGQDDGPYAEIVLGNAVGLSQFGVHLERIPARFTVVSSALA